MNITMTFVMNAGYGDDYYYDEELDELVCRCGTCWVNELRWGEKE